MNQIFNVNLGKYISSNENMREFKILKLIFFNMSVTVVTLRVSQVWSREGRYSEFFSGFGIRRDGTELQSIHLSGLNPKSHHTTFVVKT